MHFFNARALRVASAVCLFLLLSPQLGLAEEAAESELNSEVTLESVPLDSAHAEDDAIKVAQNLVPLHSEGEKTLRYSIAKLKESEHSQDLLLAVTKTFLNGSIVTWSVMFTTRAPLTRTLPMGIILGTFSGLLTYKSQAVADYLAGGKTKFENVLRWFGIELAFTSLAKALAVGLKIESIAFVPAVVSVFKGSLLALWSQGLWDVSIAKNRSLDLANATPEQAIRIRKSSRAKFFAVSAASTGLTVASVMGLRAGTIGAVIMGLGGLANYVFSVMREQETDKPEISFSEVRASAQ